MQTLKAQAQASPRSFSEIQQDPLYINADAAQQALAAQEYFNQYVASQTAYKQAKPEQQKAAFNEFVTQYNIPMPDRQPITTGQGFQHKARPMVGFPAGVAGGPAAPAIQVSSPEAAQQIQRTTGQGAALALNDIAKGASFGYGDINKLTGDPLQREAFLKQNPAYGPVLQGSEFAGALLPIEATANLANRGLGQLETAGQRLAINQNVPRYLQGIAEKSVPYLRNIGNEIGKIGPIGRSMLEQGLGFGLYESAKAREGKDQFNPMGRAISGVEGFGIGALGAGVLGLAGKGIGAAYQGLKNVFTDTAGKVLQGQVQKTGEASVKYLESTAKDLQNLLEDIFTNNAQGKLSNKSIKRLSRVKDRMSRAAMGEISLTTAEVRSHRSALNQIRREVKAGVKAEGRELKPAAQVKAEAQAAQPPEPQAQPKATQAEPIKGTVAIDAEKGLYLQKEIDPKALTYEQVADKIQNKAVGEKLANAMKAGESVRVEYKAEITGRTDKAVTITAKGNIKEAVTSFTPLYFKETKAGKVMVSGYGEHGHFRSYYIDEVGGSALPKVGKQIPEAFRGEYPNIYKGQREFNINDLTARVEAKEGVLTSEAKTLANAAKGLFESDTFKQMSPEVQKILRQINKRGRFEEGELRYVLDKIKKDKKQLEAVCNLFGFK